MTIEKHEAKFILAAVSSDEYRYDLSAPCVVEIDGQAWLVSTDGHRLHMLRYSGPERGYVLLTANGDVAASDPAAQFPAVEQVIPKTSERTAVWSASDLADLVGAFKPGAKPNVYLRAPQGPSVVSGPWHPKIYEDTPECLVKAGRFREALTAVLPSAKDVERHNAKKSNWRKEDKRPAVNVRVSWSKQLDPIVITDDSDTPAWRAVIMPVRP